MTRKQFGKLTPRFSFLLNPYTNVRLSKCPLCDRLTHARKFALFIHVEGFGPVVLGKTCRYCTPCELVMAHQNELEAELAQDPTRLTPGGAPEDRYLVLGTVDRKVWRKGLRGEEAVVADAVNQMADFRTYLDLRVEPGGRRPPGES